MDHYLLDLLESRFLLPATKLGQGNIFTGICDSVNRGGLLPGAVVSGLGGCLLLGGCLVLGGCLARGGVSAPSRGCLLWGVCSQQGVSALGGLLPGGCLVETPPTATAAGDTHPT